MQGFQQISPRPNRRRILLGAAVLAVCGATAFPSSGAETAPGTARGAQADTPSAGFKAGCFVMGANRNYADERPAHRICLSAYRLDKREVTVAQYARCVTAKGCKPPVAHAPRHPTRRRCNWRRAGRSAHPLNCVTWSQAMAYCAWTGGRLPTEAEWEHAARADRGAIRRRTGFGCGQAVLAQGHHQVKLGCGSGGTRPVGTSPSDRSSAGVEDLTGNVSEWVADWFAGGYYRRSPSQDPRGPRRGRAHSVRGCSFQCVAGARLLAPTARMSSVTWDPSLGFRCARGRP